MDSSTNPYQTAALCWPLCRNQWIWRGGRWDGQGHRWPGLRGWSPGSMGLGCLPSLAGGHLAQLVLKETGCVQRGLFCVWILLDGRDETDRKAEWVWLSRSVTLDSLRPHGLQHARPPCPSPAPRVCSNSCPLSWWCHPTISSSGAPLSSCNWVVSCANGVRCRARSAWEPQ